MDYRILSRDMQDKEVKVLMSMLVPGSSICRIERLHDINAIHVYFNKETSDQELMISLYPDELDGCQTQVPIENTTLYTVYNFLNGYSTFWSNVSVEQGIQKVFKHETPILDEMIRFREKQFLEEKELKNLGLRCGEVGDRLIQYSMELDSGLKEDVALLEELDDAFHKAFRKCFYIQGLADAYRAFHLLGLLHLE